MLELRLLLGFAKVTTGKNSFNCNGINDKPEEGCNKIPEAQTQKEQKLLILRKLGSTNWNCQREATKLPISNFMLS